MSLIGLLAGGLGYNKVVSPAPNWDDITGVAPMSAETNANQSVQGITGPITLQVSWTGSGLVQLEYDIDDGSSVIITNGGTLSITRDQTLSFAATRLTAGTNTVSVINTYGNVTIDTFDVTAT